MDEEKRDSDDRQTDWLAALHFGGIDNVKDKFMIFSSNINAHKRGDRAA